LVSSGVSGESGLAFVLVEAVFSGLGIGCASVASTATGASIVREVAQGLASGLLNSFAQIGMALGLAVLFTVVAAVTDALANGEEPTSAALAEGFRWAFFVGTGLAVAACLVARSMVREKEVPRS
jgi:MFS family permease